MTGRPNRVPTIRDVAALAGVSIKTVSRVVNHEPGVSIPVSARVLDAVRLLGYQPNVAASSLRRTDRRTATIGLLLEDVSNPFFSALHRAIEDVAREHQTLVFAASSDRDPVREHEVLQALLSRRVDGLILVSTLQNHSGILPQRSHARPLVFVDRPPVHSDSDSVTTDNRVGAHMAIHHLAARGHRRIAYLGERQSVWTTAERYAGYVEGLATEGIRLEPALVRHDLQGVDAAEQATYELLVGDDAPTALFTAQNLITVGAIRTLQRLQLQHRVALIGFDDFPLAELLDPPVAVIAQDPTGLGRTAAELLFARLRGDSQPPQRIVVPVRLLPRASGDISASYSDAHL